MNDNPTTTGMDGADCDEWHDAQHEVDGGMFTAAVAAVAALAGLALLAVLLAGMFA